MGGTIALHTDAGDEVRIVVVTDGSSTQYPGDADIRARKEEEAVRAAAELGVTDYVHLDLPDMRLDTLPHVDVNRVVEEHVRRLRAGDRLHAASRREPGPPSAVRFRRGRDPPDPGPGRATRAYLRADLEHGVDSGSAQLVRAELVRGHDGRRSSERSPSFAHYETERRDYPHPRSERAIRAAAEFYGASCGCEHAEPFVLVRGREPL